MYLKHVHAQVDVTSVEAGTQIWLSDTKVHHLFHCTQVLPSALHSTVWNINQLMLLFLSSLQEITKALCIDSLDNIIPSPNNCCFNSLQRIHIFIIMLIRIWKEERSSKKFFPLYLGIMSLGRDELRDYLKPLFASIVDCLPLLLKHYTTILQKASVRRIIQSH